MIDRKFADLAPTTLRTGTAGGASFKSPARLGTTYLAQRPDGHEPDLFVGILGHLDEAWHGRFDQQVSGGAVCQRVRQLRRLCL